MRRSPATDLSADLVHGPVRGAFRAALNERLEQLLRRVAVGTVHGRRARAEKERAVGGVQQHRHHVRTAEVAEDASGARRLAERRHAVRTHKRSSMRFALLVLTLIATAVVVTIAMFQTLYYVMG